MQPICLTWYLVEGAQKQRLVEIFHRWQIARINLVCSLLVEAFQSCPLGTSYLNHCIVNTGHCLWLYFCWKICKGAGEFGSRHSWQKWDRFLGYSEFRMERAPGKTCLGCCNKEILLFPTRVAIVISDGHCHLHPARGRVCLAEHCCTPGPGLGPLHGLLPLAWWFLYYCSHFPISKTEALKVTVIYTW